MKNLLVTLVKIGLSVGIVGYLLSTMDIQAVWTNAQRLTAFGAIGAIVIALSQIFIASMRWAIVVRACGSAFRLLTAARYFTTGLFFNLVIPGMIGGDVVRAVKAHRTGTPLSVAINSVLLERVLTVSGLVFFVTALTPMIMNVVGDSPISLVFPVLSVVCVVGIVVLVNLNRAPRFLLRGKLGQGADIVTQHARAVLLRPKYLFSGIGLTMLGQTALSMIAFSLGTGIGLELSIVDYLILIPPTILAMTLPISIAGWGVREGTMVYLFGYVGVAPEAALTLSVLFGLVNMLPGFIGGVFWLMDGGRKSTAALDTLDQPVSNSQSSH